MPLLRLLREDEGLSLWSDAGVVAPMMPFLKPPVRGRAAGGAPASLFSWLRAASTAGCTQPHISSQVHFIPVQLSKSAPLAARR